MRVSDLAALLDELNPDAEVVVEVQEDIGGTVVHTVYDASAVNDNGHLMVRMEY